MISPSESFEESQVPHVDVIIVGAGLAGLSLARQLLLETDLNVLHLEREPKVPVPRQKVGESNVQVAGHYFAKVLDLEEHLFNEHVMKYNLRFMWKTGAGDDIDHYSQAYIRQFSNIACYQMDRNKIEDELLHRNRADERYAVHEGIQDLEIELGPERNHQVRYRDHDGQEQHYRSRWIVDTTGRGRLLTRQQGGQRESEIQHSAVFFWMDGVINIEKLTKHSRKDFRLRPSRRQLGHLPLWLATNHFMGEGFWFWVIPLQGRTSFGLVFDQANINIKDVSTKEKLLAWLTERFPLFEGTLSAESMIDFALLHSYSCDCQQTIDESGWAISGIAGRFTDPLYSPGGDAIAIYNTLIVDAVQTDDPTRLSEKVRSYEMLMKTVYRSFVPTFAQSYDALGDQESFSMKYVWELTVYFSFYVFPFINDLYTDRLFIVAYLRRFSQLGPINQGVLGHISQYYQWKKAQGLVGQESSAQFFDFTNVESLKRAESCFYRVGVTATEAREILDQQLANLDELARYVVVHIQSVVNENPSLLHDAGHIDSIDFAALEFESPRLRRLQGRQDHTWQVDANAFHSLTARLENAEQDANVAQ